MVFLESLTGIEEIPFLCHPNDDNQVDTVLPLNQTLCHLSPIHIFRAYFWYLVVVIIIIISCHRFSFFPGTSPLEPVVNPTTQASSLSL
jgi:hypothetical protein